MIYEDFIEKVKGLSFSTYEADFPKSKNPPVVVYQKGVDKSAYADGKNVFQQKEVVLHLITERKDIKSQATLEKWLKDNNFSAKMSDRFWDPDNNFYITEYRFYIL